MGMAVACLRSARLAVAHAGPPRGGRGRAGRAGPALGEHGHRHRPRAGLPHPAPHRQWPRTRSGRPRSRRRRAGRGGHRADHRLGPRPPAKRRALHLPSPGHPGTGLRAGPLRPAPGLRHPRGHLELTMHPTRAAAHFPLVPRPRPAARPPADRIGELAATARELRDGAEAMEAVARVFNRTALLYSDLGMAEEARRLCWEHADIYTGAYPLDGCTARMSLEPVVNLARLAIRAGEGARGHRILHALHEGAAQARPVRVEDRTLHLERITAAPADRAELVRWLWMVLLGDGLRALAAD